MDFMQRLNAAVERNNSLLCVGLDTEAGQVRARYGLEQAQYNRRLIEATSDLVCAYKPNLAFYEAQGIDGLRALEQTLAAIPSHIVTIADAKRGDIGTTAEQYAAAWLGRFGFDAITINPYMGWDAVAPFAADPARGVFLLCLTSNPGADDFEYHGQPPLYECVAAKAAAWNTRGNLGCVVGATRAQALARVRELLGPTAPILVPGVGAQGGSLDDAVRNGLGAQQRGVVINASRSILFAGEGARWADASRAEAQRLRDAINALRV